MKLTLFYTMLKHSVTSISRYNNLLLVTNRTMAAYFVFWVGVLLTVQTVFFSLVSIPQFVTFLSESLTEAAEHFPADLELVWNGSHLKANTTQVEVFYPSTLNDAESYQLPPQLGVYRTDITSFAQTEEETYRDYLAVITPTELYLQEATGEWRAITLGQLLTSVPSQTITKESMKGTLETWYQDQKETQQTLQVLVLLPYFLLLLSGTLITFGFRSILLVAIIRYVMKIPTTYKMALKLTTLFTIPTLLIESLLVLLYGGDLYGLSGFTFWILFSLYIWFGKLITSTKSSS